MRYLEEALNELPTLHSGHYDNLKMEDLEATPYRSGFGCRGAGKG